MKRWLALVIGILALAIFIIFINPQELALSFTKADPCIFVWAVFLSFLCILLLGLRLQVIFTRIQKSTLAFTDFFKIYISSMLLGHISPAKAGEFVKTYIFNKKVKTPYSKSIAVVLIEKISELGALSLLSLILLMFLISMMINLEYYLFSTVLLLITVVIFVYLLSNKKFLDIIFKLPVASKIDKNKIAGFQNILKENMKPKTIAKPFIITMVVQLLSASRMYVIFLSLGIQTQIIPVLFIFLVTQVIGIISMVPGGWGSIEISGTLLYSTLLNIDMLTVTTAMLLLRFSTYIIDIPLGAISSYKIKNISEK